MKVLGVSGSPTKDSNTDALVKAILDATGAEIEFVKLSDIKVGPCIACMKCVCTNECVLNDDFKWLSKKVMERRMLLWSAHQHTTAQQALLQRRS